jgi:hypothetical protein
MTEIHKTIIFVFILSILSYGQTKENYLWLDAEYSSEYYSISNIPLPAGYSRVEINLNSFQEWLRYLPLLKDQDKVRLFDESLKSNQNAHYKIIDIDVGERDLQQCADAIIRLYSEYLYSQGKYADISFNFTSGDRASFIDWGNGQRPIIRDNVVEWKQQATYDRSYQNFRKYLITVFAYAGSYSLAKEMKDVEELSDIRIGDVFLQGDFPGHGVIVVDLAINQLTNDFIILLAQSYMPAQDIHILKNLNNISLSPWYHVGSTNKLYTPEWTFEWNDIKRFK